MPTGISSTFSIISSDTVAAGQTLTITNPGRTFKVISVRIKGHGSAVGSLAKGDAGGASTVIATGAIADSPLEGWVEMSVSGSVSTLTATNELRLSATGGSIGGVSIQCVGSPQQSLTAVVA